MRLVITALTFLISLLSFGQMKHILGTYSKQPPGVRISFNQDSTFEYASEYEHPTFFRGEPFFEKGLWTVSGDTIILNPQLGPKPFVQSELLEQEINDDTAFLLTFNHVKRYFDDKGDLYKTDTLQVDRLDYSFNELKKRKLTRVAPHRTVRCTFAGYIPREIITASRTIAVKKPAEEIRSIFVGCYELQDTKEFLIKNAKSNRFTLNVYSNYYQNGQIRRMKLLIKNDRTLYARQKPNGKFEKDNFWDVTTAKLKRPKDGK